MKNIKYAIVGFGGIAENRIAKEGFALDSARGTIYGAWNRDGRHVPKGRSTIAQRFIAGVPASAQG